MWVTIPMMTHLSLNVHSPTKSRSRRAGPTGCSRSRVDRTEQRGGGVLAPRGAEDGGRGGGVGRRQEAARATAMASSSKASDSSPQHSKVRGLSPLRSSIPPFAGPIPLIRSLSIFSSSCFPISGALQRLDQGMDRDAATASVAAIHSKLAQLKREIQSGRLAYIKVSGRADHFAGISWRSSWSGFLC